MLSSGGGDSAFAYKMLIFAIVIMFAMPLMVNIFVPQLAISVDQDELMDDYYDFTGAARGKTDESVWVLTGIYTPFGVDSNGNVTDLFNYTEDNWIYSSRIKTYSPYQYDGTNTEFTVQRDESTGIYRYYTDSADYDPDTGIGHRGGYDNDGTKRDTPGDLYTDVVFDINHRSDIFFSKALKYDSQGNPYDDSKGGLFFYEFSGWRYSFSPIADQWTNDADGNKIRITATETSLSLIWYYYYNNIGGISGQLIIGDDKGVAYLSGDQIVRAFDSTTSTARFNMTFNGGVQMGIYVKISQSKLSEGYTIQECYDYGYWSIMVTSLSTDADAYTGTDYTLNIYNVFDTLVDLMTFNYSDYNMSAMMGTICSFIIVIPLYAGLISLAIYSYPVLIFTGVLAGFQTIASVITNWGWLGGIFG